jgi:Ca2+-binding RTX toxin-like protein
LDDTFNFATGNKNNYTIDAGAGADALNYASAGAALTATLNAASTSTITSTVAGQYGTTTFSNVEAITGSGLDDTFNFSAGNKNNYAIDGSGGTGDWLNYSNADAALSVNLDSKGSSTVASTVTGQFGTTVFWNIEKVTTGLGADTITIGSGDTTAYTVDGGGGNDTLNGGSGYSTLSYASSGAGVTVNINAGAGISTGAGTDSFSNFKIFLGSASADTFNIAHTDTTNYDLKGNGGSDIFIVGQGTNKIDGGSGATGILSFESATKAVTTTLTGASAGTGGGADAGSNTFTNIKTFIGGSGGDKFTADNSTTAYSYTGGSGNDSLTGGAGNDMLIAGDGVDTLKGGAGTDTLDLAAKNTSLAGDVAMGGGGSVGSTVGDTFIINNKDISGIDSKTLIQGSDAFVDTLVIKATSNATLIDLTSLNGVDFYSIDKLDVSADSVESSVKLNLATIIGLVDATSGTPTLSIKLGTNDVIVIPDDPNYSHPNIPSSTPGAGSIYLSSNSTLLAQINYTH